MKEYVELIISILTLITGVGGLCYAIRRFGLNRELFTFLRISVEARSVYDAGNVVLVAITVHLENKGDTRVNARREKRKDGYLYNDDDDTCLHAGTLKIRAIPQENEPLLFDWYSLPPLRATTRLVPQEKVVVTDADLEQINYLDEFQDPETDYKEADFWLELRESYDLTVLVWLRPGVYAAKGFFLGPATKHQEEEYWSCQAVFTAGAQSEQDAAAPGSA